MLNNAGETALSRALTNNINQEIIIKLLDKGAIVEEDEFNIKLFHYSINNDSHTLAEKCLSTSLPKCAFEHQIQFLKILNRNISDEQFAKYVEQIAHAIHYETLTEQEKITLVKFILECYAKLPKTKGDLLFKLLNTNNQIIEWSHLLTDKDFNFSSLVKIDNPQLFEILFMKTDFNSNDWKVVQEGPFPNHPRNYLALASTQPLLFAKVFIAADAENKMYLLNTFCKNYINFFTHETEIQQYLQGLKLLILNCNEEQLKLTHQLIKTSTDKDKSLKTVYESFSEDELRSLLEKHGTNVLNQAGPELIESVLNNNKFDNLKPIYERLKKSLFEDIYKNPQLLRDAPKDLIVQFIDYLSVQKIDIEKLEISIKAIMELIPPKEMKVEQIKTLFNLIPSQSILPEAIELFIMESLDAGKDNYDIHKIIPNLTKILLDKELDIPLRYLLRLEGEYHKVNSALIRKFFRCFEKEPINDKELTPIVGSIDFTNITAQQILRATAHIPSEVIQKAIKSNVNLNFRGKLVQSLPKEAASVLQSALASVPIDNKTISLIVATSNVNVLVSNLPHELAFIAKAVKHVNNKELSAALINEAQDINVDQESLIEILPVVFNNIATKINHDAFFDKLPKNNEVVTRIVLNEALESKNPAVLYTLFRKMSIEQLNLVAPGPPKGTYLERFLPLIDQSKPEVRKVVATTQRDIRKAQTEADINLKVDKLTPGECFSVLTSVNDKGINFLSESAFSNADLQCYYAFKLFEKAYSKNPWSDEVVALANEKVKGKTALYVAAESNNVKFLKLFLEKYPFLNKTLNSGPKGCAFAITAAAQAGGCDAVKALVTLDHDGYWHELWYPYNHPLDSEGKKKTLFHHLGATDTTGEAINIVLNLSKTNEKKFVLAITSKIDNHGTSPFVYLLQNPHCAVVLGSISANIKKWGYVGQTPWRLEHIFDFQIKRNNGYTDLEWAIKTQRAEVVTILKENTAPDLFNTAFAKIDSERDWVEIERDPMEVDPMEVEPMEVENRPPQAPHESRKSLIISQDKTPMTAKHETSTPPQKKGPKIN